MWFTSHCPCGTLTGGTPLNTDWKTISIINHLGWARSFFYQKWVSNAKKILFRILFFFSPSFPSVLPAGYCICLISGTSFESWVFNTLPLLMDTKEMRRRWGLLLCHHILSSTFTTLALPGHLRFFSLSSNSSVSPLFRHMLSLSFQFFSARQRGITLYAVPGREVCACVRVCVSLQKSHPEVWDEMRSVLLHILHVVMW